MGQRSEPNYRAPPLDKPVQHNTDRTSTPSGSDKTQPLQAHGKQTAPLSLTTEFLFAPLTSAPAVLGSKLWLINERLYKVGQFSCVSWLKQHACLSIED